MSSTERKDSEKRGEASQGAGAPRRRPAAGARFAYEGLDRLLHERARLSILTSLASHPDGLVFNDLKMLCALTDGNLSRQLQLLAEAGLIEVWKGQRNRRPQTLARLTGAGRKRFSEYLSVLEEVIADAATNERRVGAAAEWARRILAGVMFCRQTAEAADLDPSTTRC